MQRRRFLQSASAVALATSTAQADQRIGPPTSRAGSGNIVLTEKEYFEGPGLVFLVFHNNYSGMQGGLQMIQNGERLLDSGGLLLTAKGGSGRTAARVFGPVVERARATETIIGEVPDLKLGYQLICRAAGG